MTNEEKIKELAFKNYPPRITYDGEYDLNENDRILFIEGALQMSQWKDVQFKEYLEKKKLEANKQMEKAYEGGDQWDFYIAEQNKQVFTDIINELFKKE